MYKSNSGSGANSTAFFVLNKYIAIMKVSALIRYCSYTNRRCMQLKQII